MPRVLRGQADQDATGERGERGAHGTPQGRDSGVAAAARRIVAALRASRNTPCWPVSILQVCRYRNRLVKIMLFREPSANETFPTSPEPVEGLSGDEKRSHQPAFESRTRPVAIAAVMSQGDEVVFERLDLAEILGIWRHARGRVVGLRGPGDAPATVDVKFDGHDTLEAYLPDLFRRVQ